MRRSRLVKEMPYMSLAARSQSPAGFDASPDIGAESTVESGLIAEDGVTRDVVAVARRVAESDVTVMLTGESGVGKEVFARFIHQHSSRRRHPFVALNCAAIPDTLLEATLFGHEKGAFTGAGDARAGKFEQAEGGTLLLDEVTEMPLGLQAKLLRVLQEREVERLGAAGGRRIDVRVIATSNRDLRKAVTDGVLREDLYYRLNVFPLHVPPLRDRRGDILPLARCLLRRHVGAGRVLPEPTQAAAERLAAHAWPGNVRELDNVMQRALVLQRGNVIGLDDIRLEDGAPAAPAAAGVSELGSALRVSESELILDALRAERGRKKAAAERLGISPRTLRYKLARLREMGFAVP
ncbi:MAG: sigma-54-dependent Fis family transcriptional regulator [Gammaproteobacteria bacterium]|nr:sigma-54-dependent Fis family transcriptional regulator [Gammaproteobacteria bacterium]